MLLVATPQQPDPRFSETVVLLLDYGPASATGVMINRPTWVKPADVFPDLEFLQRYRDGIHIGGPVAPASILVLFRSPVIDLPDGVPVVDDVYVSGDIGELREILSAANGERTARLYAGYAGWGPGQLDQEIAAGSWQVVPATGDQVFTREPLELWQQVYRWQSEMSVGLPAKGSPMPVITAGTGT